MTMTQAELLQIVAQASSLSDYLKNGLFKLGTAQVNEQEIGDAKLTHWCQVVAQGNWEKFQKRLQWDGLDIDAANQIIKNLNIADNQPLPNWAETLREIIQTASSFSSQDESKISVAPENPLLFEDVLLPALSVARQKLLICLDSASFSPDYLPLKLLSEATYSSLERNLLARLVTLCAKTLEFEFYRFRPLGHSLLNLLEEVEKGSNSKIHYNAFVQKLLNDGLLAFFQQYPVLGRLVATRVDFWVESTAEFLQRLKTDIWEIQKVFGCATDSQEKVALTKVVEIKPSLSDSHNRGRSVTAITFESGLKLVYKPKDLALEVAYIRFLDWCNQGNIPLSLKVLKVLNRQGYGWVEYVEQLPCKDEAAARRLYKRVGMLLCLLYVGVAELRYDRTTVPCSSGE